METVIMLGFMAIGGFPESGVCFGGPQNKDYKILGSTQDFPNFWDTTMLIHMIQTCKYSLGSTNLEIKARDSKDTLMATVGPCTSQGLLQRTWHSRRFPSSCTASWLAFTTFTFLPVSVPRCSITCPGPPLRLRTHPACGHIDGKPL